MDREHGNQVCQDMGNTLTVESTRSTGMCPRHCAWLL